MQESMLDIDTLAGRLQSLLGDRPRLLAMAEAARSLAKPDATDAIAAVCLEVAA
jgi:UDP-N-acetylglucosamine--N-acetylmuramyl-(pentapeptide) pyrophosphoryl-undecaprenol N-acetylglucosamine transferase